MKIRQNDQAGMLDQSLFCGPACMDIIWQTQNDSPLGSSCHT